MEEEKEMPLPAKSNLEDQAEDEIQDQAEDEIQDQAEKAGAKSEIDINQYMDQGKLEGKEKEQLESDLMNKIEEEQQKGTELNVSALVRMGAVYTARYVPEQERGDYIDEYCKLIGGFLNFLEVQEALGHMALGDLSPGKRLILGFVGFLAGSIFLPLTYRKDQQ
jgi:hypothetical protein